jgi:hypothetical protein
MRKMPWHIAGILIALTALNAVATPAPLIFPHFAQGGGYRTTFTFNNLSTAPAKVLLSFYSQNGEALGSAVVTVAGLGSGTTMLAGGALTVGWARAEFTGVADIAGTEIIDLAGADGNPPMETSVLSAQPDTLLRSPVFEKEGFRTGLALVNPGAEGTEVSIVPRNSEGIAMGSLTIFLAGSQQIARFVSELFPSLGSFEGTLEISSTQPVAGLALRYNGSDNVFSTLQVSPQSAEVHFSPNGGISALIVAQIENARTSIDIEIYEFTRTEIMNALIAAKNRAVSIRILADSSEASEAVSVVPRLEAAGIPVRRTAGSGGGIMHDKVALFDGQVLVTGSYNWSTAAEQSNDENALLLRTPSLVSVYQSTFDKLWSR